MDTITDILNIKFKGNFTDDRENYARIDLFCLRDDVPMKDKRTALNFASTAGMGIECDLTADEFAEAMTEIREFYRMGRSYSK